MKRYNFKGNIYLIIIAFILFGCEEKVDWKHNIVDNGILVVDAIVTDEFITQEIFLSLSQEDINDTPEPVKGALIYLFGENEKFTFSESSEYPGIYRSDKVFSAKLNKDYRLEINWNNEFYIAKSKMVQVIPPVEITFKPEEGDNLSINEVAPLYSPHEQAMYEIDIDWTHIVQSDSAKAKMFFYTFNTVDVNEVFRPSRQNVIFPKGSIIIEKKYSLNPEMAKYFRALLMETEWQGGYFDEAPSSLPTNISNGALGFFGVCSVLTDTIIAN